MTESALIVARIVAVIYTITVFVSFIYFKRKGKK